VRKDGRVAGRIGWREGLHNRGEWKEPLRMTRNRRILHMLMNEYTGFPQKKQTLPEMYILEKLLESTVI
jgi:hypothetical protein